MGRHTTGDRYRRKGQGNGARMKPVMKGRGKLKCNICSAPYSKHDIGPCPFAIEGELQHKPSRQPAGRIY